MQQEDVNEWRPPVEDLALWRFFRVSRREAIAGLCLTDGHLSMATMPPDKVLSEAFWLRHGGHQVMIVSDRLDSLLAEARK